MMNAMSMIGMMNIAMLARFKEKSLCREYMDMPEYLNQRSQ